jgi:hypothetical protein
VNPEEEEVGLALDGVEEANRLKLVFIGFVDRDADSKLLIVLGWFRDAGILLQDVLSIFMLLISEWLKE